MQVDPPRVMFVYLGRRGPMSKFVLEIGRTAHQLLSIEISLGVSRQNENYALLQGLTPNLFAFDTFASSIGAATQAWRIPALRRLTAEYIAANRIQTVVDLMPHVWSPFLVSSIKRTGARYMPIVHDVQQHPGDVTGLVTGWTARVLHQADQVITLSTDVTDKLAKLGRVPGSKINTLFHPDLVYAPPVEPVAPSNGAPVRLLFLGRILAYKGLPIFLDAVDELRAQGVAVEVGVFGEGSLGANAARLRRPGCEVVNRWLTEDEIADALARYHAVVACHTEASQSGVVAAAFGALRPVVATPVGALPQQVCDGVTGAIAERIDGASVAAAIRGLMDRPAHYHSVVTNIREQRRHRSMQSFLEAVTRITVPTERSDT